MDKQFYDMKELAEIIPIGNNNLYNSVTIGYNPDGTQRRQYVYAKTRHEVAERMNEIIYALQTNTFIDRMKNPTMGVWLDTWLSEYKKNSIKPTTYDQYEYLIRYHQNQMPWKRIFEQAISMNYRSHQTSTCGLHCHVSRAAFGDTYEEQEKAIARVVYFVESHWNELLKFSRRTPTNIMRWAARYGIAENTHNL